MELQKSSFGLSVDQLVLKSYKIRMYESGMAILQEHSWTQLDLIIEKKGT